MFFRTVVEITCQNEVVFEITMDDNLEEVAPTIAQQASHEWLILTTTGTIFHEGRTLMVKTSEIVGISMMEIERSK